MPEERRHPHVVNIEEVEPRSQKQGRFSSSARRLGAATGARGIGCTLFEIEPGNTAFPAHYHCGNEESLYVLDGRGTLRIGDDRVELRAGDYATFPVGPTASHQLIATGDSTLRYLCFSTLITPEVVGYPDSNKIGAIGVNPERGAKDIWVAKWFPAEANVDYFEGEDR